MKSPLQISGTVSRPCPTCPYEADSDSISPASVPRIMTAMENERVASVVCQQSLESGRPLLCRGFVRTFRKANNAYRR